MNEKMILLIGEAKACESEEGELSMDGEVIEGFS